MTAVSRVHCLTECNLKTHTDVQVRPAVLRLHHEKRRRRHRSGPRRIVIENTVKGNRLQGTFPEAQYGNNGHLIGSMYDECDYFMLSETLAIII
jgi:hypothetical protein